VRRIDEDVVVVAIHNGYLERRRSNTVVMML